MRFIKEGSFAFYRRNMVRDSTTNRHVGHIQMRRQVSMPPIYDFVPNEHGIEIGLTQFETRHIQTLLEKLETQS